MKFIGLTAFALSCVANVVNAADCGCLAGPRIIDGKNVPVTAFPTVGLVTSSRTGFTCTGTLIAPRYVLTAAHCLVNGGSGLPSVAADEGRFVLNGVSYKTVRVITHPTYLGNQSQEIEDAIDLGLFELEADVPGVTPTPLYRQVPTVGTLMTLVGLGEQGTGTTGGNGTFPTDGTINTGTTTIDQVTRTFIKWNFDERTGTDAESNTAPGDSGGPQFITVNGVLTVASVTSGGNDAKSRFGDVSYNTRVDIAANWIDSIMSGTPGVIPNAPPVIQSFSASKLLPQVGESVDFIAAASDVNGDVLLYTWDFGDGIIISTATANAQHTFATAGVYTVQLTVTDGKGGSVSQSISLTVGLIEALVIKKKFGLNFTNSFRSNLDFTFYNDALFFADKFAFAEAMESATIKIFVDTTEIDAMTLIGAKGFGKGNLTFTSRKGYVRYQAKALPDLADILQKFGATNSDVQRTVTVPLRIEINGTRYGADGQFTYKARAGKTGIGK